MKKTAFTTGTIAGATALVIAVPVLAQFAGAQSAPSSTATQPSVSGTQTAQDGGLHIGANGVREELLTGDAAAKVTSAALVAVPGGTVDRVETDTEGDVYEAHMTKADGSRVTVKFDADFNVTDIEEGKGGHKADRQI